MLLHIACTMFMTTTASAIARLVPAWPDVRCTMLIVTASTMTLKMWNVVLPAFVDSMNG